MPYFFSFFNSIVALDAVKGFFQDLNDDPFQFLIEGIGNVFETIIYNTIYRLLYYIEIAICKLVYYLDMFCQVFMGSRKVYYDGEYSFLTNVFFNNRSVNSIYWRIAMIGIIFAFAFAIIAVVRKIFDLRDKDQRSLGQILLSLGKTILLILSMNIIMTAVLDTTNILMQQLEFIFDNPTGMDKQITFTEQQYAAMGKCLNTIGNYSLNISYDSRYNINACFNEIRPQLQYLDSTGMFEFDYDLPDENYEVKTDKQGRTTYTKLESWQSLLTAIANSTNVNRELKADAYNESAYKAVKNAMDALKKNQNLRPLSHYERAYGQKNERITLDRYVFLIATLSAAKNDKYNESPELTDPARGPFYYGDKDIYNVYQVSETFDISIFKFNYVIGYFMAGAMTWNLGVISMTCVSRIFNLLVLYLISPLVFAAEPLDDGAKRKQWTIAFLVQSMGIFGTVISMRVLMLFIPIILGSNFQIFYGGGIGDTIMNLLAKIFMIYAGFEVVKKANGMITGILADSAGWQSIQAGDMTAYGESAKGGLYGFMRHPIATPVNTVANAFGFQGMSTGKKGGGEGGGGGGGGGGKNLPPKQK